MIIKITGFVLLEGLRAEFTTLIDAGLRGMGIRRDQLRFFGKATVRLTHWTREADSHGVMLS